MASRTDIFGPGFLFSLKIAIITENMEIFNPSYPLALIGGFLAAVLLVPLFAKLAGRLGIVDRPDSRRKFHRRAVPLLGGIPVFLAVALGVGLFRWLWLANFSEIPDKFLWAAGLAGLVIVIVGFFEDKYRLKPVGQLAGPVLAAGIILAAGIRIEYITNFFGGSENALIYLSPIIGGVITFGWLLGMMYTTKLLDGLDGLVAGVGAVGGLIIFLLSLRWDVPLSATGAAALVFSGALLGFLIFNWQPAKIFLGEGGSVLIGFILGILSIISGSKIATTLLVVGIPALDVGWVMIQRLLQGQSPFSHPDRKHLHFQLLELGFSERETVLFFCAVALLFGSIAIITGPFGKLAALAVLVAVMAALAALTYFKWLKKSF